MKTEDVQWVVNDLGELGVKIEGQFFFLYKGESLSYGASPHNENGEPMRYRPVFKREFGECCTAPLGVSLCDSVSWAPIVEKLDAPAAPSVIVYGPKGCGKTTNRELFLKTWGLRASVELDEQPRGFKLPSHEVLALTFKDAASAGKLAAKVGARVLSFEQAMQECAK